MGVIVTIEEAAQDLATLIERVRHGEDIAVAKDGHVVARLVRAPEEPAVLEPRKPGSAKGQVWMADDFDALLGTFKDFLLSAPFEALDRPDPKRST